MKYAKPELGDLDKACSAFHSLSFVDSLNCFFHDIQGYFIQTSVLRRRMRKLQIL